MEILLSLTMLYLIISVIVMIILFVDEVRLDNKAKKTGFTRSKRPPRRAIVYIGLGWFPLIIVALLNK